MTHRQRQLRRTSRHGRRNTLLLVLAVIVCAVLIGAISFVGYIIAVADSAPDISHLKPIDKGASSIIYAADNSRLGYVQSDTIRTPIPWTDMPGRVRQATVAIEDRRFYHHAGVDYASIFRAAWKDVTRGKTLQGGSTITQQLV